MLKAYLVRRTFTSPTDPSKPVVMDSIQVGVGSQSDLDKFKDTLQNPPGNTSGVKTGMVDQWDVDLYVNPTGDIFYGIEGSYRPCCRCRPTASNR